ncbi:MAG: hypothetical protein ACK2UW_16785 [Anaerolineales bacterium]
MKSKIIASLALFLASFVTAYTLYVYVVQTPTFFSRSRLAIAGLLWVAILAGGIVFIRGGHRPAVTRAAGWSIAALFLLLNLLAAGRLFRIPYTYVLLPVQTVQVQPLPGGQPVELISFSTELVDSLSLENFQTRDGWEAQGNHIVQMPGSRAPLVWQGRPGEYVQLELGACSDCGTVQVQWGDRQTQAIELSSAAGRLQAVRYDYASLQLHKLLNLLALELSFLVAAVVLFILGRFFFANFSQTGVWSMPLTQQLPRWLPYLALGGLTLLIYGFNLRPILFNDDWCIAFQMNFHDIQLFSLTERRPIMWFFPVLFDRFLPIHMAIDLVFVSLLLEVFIISALFYILVNQLTNGRSWFAFLAACLLMVFPNDYTRFYFVMLNNRLNFILMLVLMILFIKFLRQDHWVSGWLTIPIFAISLLMYEGHLGIALLWPLILAVAYRRRMNLKKGLLLAGYYLVLGLFLIWKLYLQPLVYRDSKLDSIQVSFAELVQRGLNSFRTILGGFKFPYPDSTWMTPLNLILLLGILISLAGLFWLARRRYQVDLAAGIGAPALPGGLLLLLTGSVLWTAGLVPILLNYPPNIYGHLSRVNLFSQPGAVLVLLSLLYILFSGMVKTPDLAARLTTVSVLGFFLVGAVVQLQTQEAYNRSWQDVQAFYQELFQQVPDILPGTQVYLELSGYDGPGNLYRPLYSSSWEAQCSFRTLYDQRDLPVGYIYDRITVPPFPGFNILTSTLETESLRPIVDPAKLLILQYDDRSGALDIQMDASKYLPPEQNSLYAPQTRIQPLERPLPTRELVQ